MKKFALLICCCWLFLLGAAQTNGLVVGGIYIEGNKKTKIPTVLRELDFSIGDTLSKADLTSRLEKNRLLLISTGLFNKVDINIKNLDADQLDLLITVKEDWYIYPLPTLDLADRNFNEWWRDYNHAFNRLNWGMKFYWENFTGRNDRIKLIAQFGYTQKYEFDYRLPFFNRGQSIGLSYNILYSRNREINYITQNDKPIPLQEADENDLIDLKRFRTGALLTYRPKLRERFEFGAHYHNYKISDTLQVRNPDFIASKDNRQQFISLVFQLSSDHRDQTAYPMKGHLLLTKAEKNGIGIFNEVNNFSVEATLAKYFSIKKKWSIELVAKGKTNLIRSKQPYYQLQRGLGYKTDFIRGYEFYVIDGQDFAFLKSSFRFQLVNHELTTKIMPIRTLQYIPIQIYLKLNMDNGFVNNQYRTPDNELPNKWLWGGGPAIDIVLYHEYVVQLEFSVNRLGEKGLYLHYKFLF